MIPTTVAEAFLLASAALQPPAGEAVPVADLLPVTTWSVVVRIGVAPLGQLLGCSTEEQGPVPQSLGANCSSVEHFQTETLLFLRGGPGPGPMAVDMRTTMVIEGEPLRTPPPPLPRGRRVIAHVAASVTIDEQGRIARCRIVEKRGHERPAVRFCEEMFGPFQPPLDAAGQPVRRNALISYSIVAERRPFLLPNR